jgi:acyl-CoA synthetase (AMP-forming)/AMP-acid ligase II
MPGDGQIHPVSANDPALITFTSGSSGMPKGANRTHGFLAAQHRALSLEFPYHDGDVDMPMFPVFALNNIAQGISSVVPQVDFRRVDTMDTARILRQIYRHGVTTCTASPVFFDRLATHVEETPRMRPHLRRILTGGAPVSNSQLRAWQRAFQETEIHVVYGSTEAEPVASISAAECLSAADESRSRAPGYCVGRPTEQVRTRIIRIQRGPVTLEAGGWPSWEIPPHEIGELLVTGEHVCRDYYRSQSAVRENKIIEPPGTIWHRMGDTGYFDRAGRFWLVGRVHSTIFRAGQAIHPQLVEQAAVADDPRIRRAATVGFPDEHLGERVVLALETEANGELRAEVEARLREAGQITDEIVLLNDKLPVDPRHNAKIDYNRLRKQLRGRLSRGSGR